jgi:hypothetical protein
MKNIFLLLLLILFLSCDSDKVNDCFQSSGTIISEEFFVSNFTKVKINRDIELILIEGPIQKVLVETGENLLNDIEAEVINSQLILTNGNICNFVRDYNVTKIYVTTPNIEEINSSTQFKISSQGVLNFPSIKILSENFNDSSTIAVGEINLNLNSQEVRIVANNLTSFSFNGFTDVLNINFAAGNGIFDGANMIANKVSVFHRGTNDITINPQQELSGKLVSTGNLISINQPPIVNVEVLYTGNLIFQ